MKGILAVSCVFSAFCQVAIFDTSVSSFDVGSGLPNETPISTPPICQQPLIRGDCKSLLRRYFYDSSSQLCREFFYGGCGGNENNFLSQTECESTCSSKKITTPESNLINESTSIRFEKIGACPSSDQRFNGTADSNSTCLSPCKDDTQCPDRQKCCYSEICNTTMCLPATTNNSIDQNHVPTFNLICQKPLVQGPCKASFFRWGYDGVKCVEFIYGGCQGNENNFEMQADCEKTCGGGQARMDLECPLIKIVPPPGCEVIPGAYTQNGCPMPEIKCLKGACATNPCPDLCDSCINEPQQCFTIPCPQFRCERRPNCVTPRIELPLPPQFPIEIPSASVSMCSNVVCAPGTICREYPSGPFCVFDASISTPSRSSSPTICQLPPEIGFCRATMERWFFNVASRRCERFVYGGCGGNGNNFDSRQSCESFCNANSAVERPGQCPAVQRQNAVCVNECEIDFDCKVQDQKCCSNGCGRTCVSPLVGSATSIDFNRSTSIDVQNRSVLIDTNRSSSIDTQNRSSYSVDTQNRVSGRRSPTLEILRRCRQQADAGQCQDTSTRWFFNFASASCEPFNYGGCGGNTNNFQSEQECQQMCDQIPGCPQFSPLPPPPGCNIIGWTGVDGCPMINFKCTAGECATQRCTKQCDFCVNEPKQCFTTPCPQYRCQINESCLYEQCSTIRCNGGSTCKVIDGVVGCIVESANPRCTQPVDAGPCVASMIQFYYNLASGRCEQFIYGGCQGNSNRFSTADECQRTCSNAMR